MSFSSLPLSAARPPEARQKLLSLGFEPAGGAPDQLGSFEKSERAKWGALIKAAGLKGD